MIALLLATVVVGLGLSSRGGTAAPSAITGTLPPPPPPAAVEPEALAPLPPPGPPPPPPELPGGELGQALGGAIAGAGIGAGLAELTDANDVVSIAATAGGAVGGAAIAIAGTAGIVVAAPIAAGVAILRLGQDLWELSTGREDTLRAYRERLAAAYAAGGQAAKDAEQKVIERDNAARYIELMRAPRIIPESDQHRLQYLSDRGKLLHDAITPGVAGYLQFNGWKWDYRTGSLEPFEGPKDPTTPTATTVARVTAKVTGSRVTAGSTLEDPLTTTSRTTLGIRR